jgi:hypothetical protein
LCEVLQRHNSSVTVRKRTPLVGIWLGRGVVS